MSFSGLGCGWTHFNFASLEFLWRLDPIKRLYQEKEAEDGGARKKYELKKSKRAFLEILLNVKQTSSPSVCLPLTRAACEDDNQQESVASLEQGGD